MNQQPLLARVVIIILSIAISATARAQTIWYVNDDAPNDPGPGDPTSSDPDEDGSSAHPFDAIQEAIDACANGDKVLVYAGTYAGVGNRDIDFGGRAIAVQSVGGPATCIVDCEGSGRGFYFHNSETSSSYLEGFTITNGSVPDAYGGGGICCWPGSPAINRCVIRGNTATSRGPVGGGVSCGAGSSPTIYASLITGNQAPDLGVGGGVFIEGNGSCSLIDTVIAGNHAETGGGGVAVAASSSEAFLRNCTVADNTALYGDGIIVDSGCVLRVHSCILRNGGDELAGGGTIVVAYSDVDGGWTGTGNIDADPDFADADYHLAVTSPCIDAGDPGYPVVPGDIDIDGQPRVLDGNGDGIPTIDMGADEYLCSGGEPVKLVGAHAGDWFGHAVAIDGDTAVVGARRYGDDGGGASVYRSASTGWVLDQYLFSSRNGEQFGYSVALSADVVVVGAPYNDVNGASAGAAYVFRYTGGMWTSEATLYAPDGGPGDEFGSAVAVSGDVILIGAPGFDSGCGQVYVYAYDGASWGLTDTMVDPELCGISTAPPLLGSALAIDGDIAIIGSPGWGYTTPGGEFTPMMGLAYVCRYDATDGTLDVLATARTQDPGRYFGASVAISGDRIVVGAPLSNSDSGAAFVYDKPPTGWSGWPIQTAQLVAEDIFANDWFGVSVAVAGDIALIGAVDKAYVFHTTGSGWFRQVRLAPPASGLGDGFGTAVSLSGGTAVVGASLDDENGVDAGAAYIFAGLSDCNGNGRPDACDITGGISQDCQSNGIPDECELDGNDCNANGVPDECDIVDCVGEPWCGDCNLNSIPDGCDLAECAGEPWCADCNANGVPDGCDIDSLGSIAAWGKNDAGQTDVPSPNNLFVAAAAGSSHSLGLKSDGSIVAWGDNAYGQTDVPAPNSGFVAVAAGRYHSLGLKSDGSIVAWGRGNESQIDVPLPNSGFVAVAAGELHSLGLKSDGSIIAWGSNLQGQANVPSPNSDFVAIAAGSSHSLGLKSDSSIIAWGDNTYGQTDVPSPNGGFVAIAAGYDHSLGLKANGSIAAWGNNLQGQANVPSPNSGFTAISAGVGHSLALKSDGSIVAWGDDRHGQADVPSPNSDFVKIAAGGLHSLGLKKGDCNLNGIPDECELDGNDCNANGIPDECDIANCTGETWCDDCNANGILDGCDAADRDGSIVAWGLNDCGQIDVPAPNSDFVAVAAGYNHNLGLKPDGSIVAWGDNFHGQTDVPAPNGDFVAVAPGGAHSLGLKSGGSIIAWGSNYDGQTDVPAPNSDFVAVAGGGAHSLGLKSDGSIVAWGRNDDGQLDVPAPNNLFVAVAAGGYHSLGLKSNGSIVAWGDNAYGQIDVPAPNSDFVVVAAGGFHGLGLTSDGSIVAWGSNDVGQTDVPLPNSDFVAVAAGYYHSLGLKSDGSIIAWGWNTWGQTDVPAPNGHFAAIAAGGEHSLGLKRRDCNDNGVPDECELDGNDCNDNGVLDDCDITSGASLDCQKNGIPDECDLRDCGGETWCADCNANGIPDGCDIDSLGSIAAWGKNDAGQTDVPSPNNLFVAVVAGGYHGLGLKADGSIVAWGFDDYGQIDVPPPNSDFVAVAAGELYSLGLKPDGSIVTWGANFAGQCDIPSPNNDFAAVTAGWAHALGLKSDGSIVAWGDNTYGQTDIPLPNSDFVAVTGGASHSLGLKSDGSIVAWGDNTYGQTDVPEPNSDFIAVAGGAWHSLGLKADGSIVAWGDNGSGQTDIPLPNSDFVAVAAGWAHALGLKADGSIVAWGDNTYGQTDSPLPNSGFVAIAAGGDHSLGLKRGDCNENGVPDECELDGNDCNGNGIPDGCDIADCADETWCADCNGNGMPDGCELTAGTAQDCNANGILDECDIADCAGETWCDDCNANGFPDGCELDVDGAIVAWGINDYGQTDVPAPNSDFVAIAAGFHHSLGVKSDGAISAWGDNRAGQTDIPSPNSDFVAVAAGKLHSLGLKSDGSIVGWGSNGSGQTDIPAPNSDFVAVAAGWHHSLGLKEDGSIVGWGYNASGQCDVLEPNSDFVAVAAGLAHSLGLKFDGLIVAWGDNTYGQIDVPLPNSDFVAVAAGDYHSLGLKSDGSILAWGYNIDGQTDVPSPNSDFVAIAARAYHSLGLKEVDCNANGVLDACELDSADCNANGVPDDCDLASGVSADSNGNSYPDECEPEPCHTVEAFLLLASDGEFGAKLGSSVAIDGEVAVAGAPQADGAGGLTDAGKAYASRFTGHGWVEELILQPDDLVTGSFFGCSVDISGDVMVVGAKSSVSANLGSAYIYRSDGSGWVQEAKLENPSPPSYNNFGYAAAVDGKVAIVATAYRTFYVYRYDGQGWAMESSFLVPKYMQQVNISSVAIDGDVIVVGCQDCHPEFCYGRVYVYRYDGSVWQFDQELIHVDQQWDQYGCSVAISGNTILVGSKGRNTAAGENAGSAYVFTYNNSIWTQQVMLVPWDAESWDFFGYSVALEGDLAVVGATRDNDPGTSNRGSAYVFRLNTAAGVWFEEAKLLPSDNRTGELGSSVALSGGTVIAGAPVDPAFGASSGAAYIYRGLTDCEGSDRIDLCEIIEGDHTDCNDNDTPDACDLDPEIGFSLDCNDNGVPDECDIDPFSEVAAWATFDAVESGVGTNPSGYNGIVSDGRYLYFVPYYNGAYHSEVLRYDTSGNFFATGSWAAFDPRFYYAVGYRGGVFDGRYVYFAPYRDSSGNYHNRVLRYDTSGPFGDIASWARYRPSPLGVNPVGYVGAVFDGRYVYFVPSYRGGTEAGYHGEVLRYDTTGDFATLSSWRAYDPGANGVGTDPDGFLGGVFDGRYVYFAPTDNGDERHGEVLRYDTTADFETRSSWTTYDPGEQGGVGHDPDGYIGALVAGRYVYFVPYHNETRYHAEVLRHDTLADFEAASSWASFDPDVNGVGDNANGYAFAVCDGRYIYFVPYYKQVGYHGDVLRYDTAGEFTALASWSAFDPGEHKVGSDPDGYFGGAFDGRYVYFSPIHNGTMSNGEVLRYDTAAPSTDCNLNHTPDDCESLADTDDDGIPDICDSCPGSPNPQQLDTDDDGVGDACDLCPNTIPNSPVDENGCPPLIPGDFDRDGDVDGQDWTTFESCASGPAVPHDGSETCQNADLHTDNAVDQSDFGIFQRCISGEDNPGDPTCAD